MTNNILLISCSDKPGLIFNITRILFNMGLNIIRNGEFVERKTSHFFMRTVFSGSFHEETLLTELKSCLPENALVHLSNNRKKKIVVLATREHHCLSDLLLRNAFDELHAGILCVVSNHEVLRPLTEKFEILLHDNNKNRVAEITDIHVSQIVNEIHNAIFEMPKGNVDLEVCRNSLS